MIHETFDLDYWIKKFPLADLRREARAFCERKRAQDPAFYGSEAEFESHVRLMSPGGTIIYGPEDLAVVEQLRGEVFHGAPHSEGVPTDVFVWALGNAPDPRVTKFGGRPWMRAADPWPQNAFGKPLDFFGQICFADSLDLVTALPGDILLLFQEPDGDEVDSESFHGLWSTTGASGNLRAYPEEKAAASRYYSCYAQRHRTVSYPQLEELFETSDIKRGFQLSRFQATAVGPDPFWIQGECTPSAEETCIATFSAIGCDSLSKQPFLNQAQLSHRHASELSSGLPGLGDAGCLYIFLHRRRGSVHFDIQCY